MIDTWAMVPCDPVTNEMHIERAVVGDDPVALRVRADQTNAAGEAGGQPLRMRVVRVVEVDLSGVR